MTTAPRNIVLIITASLFLFGLIGAKHDGCTLTPSTPEPALLASIVVQTEFPARISCGQSIVATVSFQNIGDLPWSKAAGIRLLAAGNNPLFAASGVDLPPDLTVLPKQSLEFAIQLSAPQLPGTTATSWQLARNGIRFGAVAQQVVQVTCALPVDPQTLSGKLIFGYQGWFATPCDGSPLKEWVHWSANKVPDAETIGVDVWPDLTLLDADELCPTALSYSNGQTAGLYSAYNEKTVRRHFQWMQAYGLDGVFLQRFTAPLKDARHFAFRNKVTNNVRSGAEQYGRIFAMMYDISGQPAGELVAVIKADWRYLVDQLKVTSSPRYLRHKGRPVLALWGLGFADRPGTPAQAAELIDWLRSSAPDRYRVTLVGGVPTHWRTLSGDAKTDADWAAVYRSFDVISPWTVGRYRDGSGIETHKNGVIKPDLLALQADGIDYMPVAFPGFSWHNLTGEPPNEIPRRGGLFFWQQVVAWQSAGAKMLYVAMFDEVDEGTAMFKLAPTKADLPLGAALVPLDADGVTVPNDWYLRLAAEAAHYLATETPAPPGIPIVP